MTRPRPQAPDSGARTGGAPSSVDVSGGRAGRVEAEGDTREWTLLGVVDSQRAFWIFFEESPPRSNGERVEVVPASLLAAERERREEAELGPAPTRSELEVQAENVRLRDLYENAVQHEKRFGWTINHLLECEEALRCAEADLEALRERTRGLEEALLEIASREPTTPIGQGAHRVRSYREAIEIAEAALSGPGTGGRPDEG